MANVRLFIRLPKLSSLSSKKHQQQRIELGYGVPEKNVIYNWAYTHIYLNLPGIIMSDG